MLSRSKLLALVILLGISGRICAAGPFSETAPVSLVPFNDTIASGSDEQGENVRIVSSVLAVFLGPFGAHRLYLGTNARVAVIYGITFGGFGILALLDLGHILFNKELEPYRNNDRVFMWSSGSPTPP